MDESPQAGFEQPSPQSSEGYHIEWMASEYLAHDKNALWYGALFGAAFILAAVIYLLTKDKVSSALIIVLAILFAAAAGRKPRVLRYVVDEGGLTIDQKFYPYSGFRSFSVMDEGAFSSIMLIPLKRFMPPISIYYEPADEDRIVELLSAYIPIEQHQHDFFDRILSKMRF